MYSHLNELQHKSPTQQRQIIINDPPLDDKSYLRVASWNIRVPFPPDIQQNLSWADRRYSIASGIARLRPHLLAVQEDCYFMNDYLMKAQTPPTGGRMLSDVYNRYGLFNRNGESQPTKNWPDNAFSSNVGKDGEHNSIWYDKRRFLAMKNVTFWLSRTPQVAGSSFDEVTGRIVNCVLLQDKMCTTRINQDADDDAKKVQCTKIFYCSTHLPSGNTTRQLWSVNVLSQMFSQFRDEFSIDRTNEKLMMMVSGDFNSIPGSDTYNAMIRSGFIDARQVSQEGTLMEEYTDTTNDWYNSENSLIDYVWIYSARPHNPQKSRTSGSQPPSNVASVRHIQMPCCDSRLSSANSLNKTASDHLMIVVDFDIVYI
ncbi:hypothetical protein ACHAXR_008604 [Thalassiosira sp. AJA248-18]